MIQVALTTELGVPSGGCKKISPVAQELEGICCPSCNCSWLPTWINPSGGLLFVIVRTVPPILQSFAWRDSEEPGATVPKSIRSVVFGKKSPCPLLIVKMPMAPGAADPERRIVA